MLPALLTAAAYALAGQLAIWLALPPAYAAPLYPAAGIALAAVLVSGWRALPGVFIGVLVVNGLLSAPRGLSEWSGLLSTLAIGLGATAQAGVGAYLVRTRATAPRDLSEPRDALVLFGLGGALACLISAGVAVTTLWLSGSLPAASVPGTALSWWSGDTLGVLVAAPMALTLIGRPRSLWRPRRLTVGLPMLVMTAVLALAAMLVTRSDERRSQSVFERDVSRASDALDSGLRTPLHALEAMHGLYLAAGDVGSAEFRWAADPWLGESGSLAAIGFSPRVRRDALDAFDAAQQQHGLPGYKVFDRPDAPKGLVAGDTDAIPVLRIEPGAPNRAALGVNSLSVPAAREAIARAVASDRPEATRGFRLSQAVGNETGVVIYRAVGRTPMPATVAGRQASLDGVVFVTLRTDAFSRAVLARVPAYLHWCLVDLDPATSRRRLGGTPNCEAARPGADLLVRAQNVDFAGRHWQLLLSARREDLPVGGHWTLWLLAVTGLLSTAMLGALLLTVTGRAHRIEAEVAERTADLRHEVQERRRAVEALRDSEQRWRNIVDHMPIGVVYTELDGLIRETNPKLRDLLGLDAASLSSRRLTDLICPADQPGEAGLLEALAGGALPQLQRRLRLVRADGSLIWVQIDLSLLRDSQGTPRRLAGVVEDITEHLRLADAERARDQAEAASQAKSEFLSRMSHELRTPLNAILGFGQLLALDREPALSPRQQSWVAEAQRAGWHLLNLINELLDLSRIETGQLHLDWSAVRPAELLQECLAMVETTARPRGLRLMPVEAPADLAVWADRTRLKQVLTNLLSNAVKYNRDGGRVQCSAVDAGGGWVQIRVSDEGPGLSAEQRAGLFQPFNRLGREGGSIEGTGLGLVISRRLVEAMGGRLDAPDTSAQGTEFMLTLPAATEANPADAMPAAPAAGRMPRYRQRRIHYIEDNETNAEVMRGVLSRRPQVRLTVSSTGEAGLASIAEDPPDLILLDMHLPDIDGLEVLRRLSEDPRSAAIPVLAVSADATPARIEQALALGAADYATKPVDLASFLPQVDALLERVDTRYD